MFAWSEPLPGSRKPVKARATRARLRRLAALTGLPPSGSLAAKRSWLPVSEVAPVTTRLEMQA